MDCVPSQIPLLIANDANSKTDGRMEGLALKHQYHEGRSCTKFG